MASSAINSSYMGWRMGKTLCWICKKAVPTTLAKAGDAICHKCQKKYFLWPSKALSEIKRKAGQGTDKGYKRV